MTLYSIDTLNIAQRGCEKKNPRTRLITMRSQPNCFEVVLLLLLLLLLLSLLSLLSLFLLLLLSLMLMLLFRQHQRLI